MAAVYRHPRTKRYSCTKCSGRSATRSGYHRRDPARPGRDHLRPADLRLGIADSRCPTTSGSCAKRVSPGPGLTG